MSSIRKRLIKNGLASSMQKGVRLLEGVLLVPFFISSWGAAYYGEWVTLTIIPSVIAFVDLGFGSAAANSLVLAYAAGEKQKAANINRTGMSLISVMIFIAMAISIIGMLIMNYFHVFEKSLIKSDEAILAVSILILARLIGFYSQLIESYYRAAKRASLSINLLTLRAGINLAAGLLVLILGYGIVFFSLSQLLVIVCFNFFYWLKGRKVLGLFKEYKGENDKELWRNILHKGFGYLMFPIWGVVYFQGTTLAVRLVLGPEAVAVFNTVRTLTRSVSQLFNVISSSSLPELQYEIGSKNIKGAQKIFKVTALLSILIAFFGAIFLSFFGLWIYNFWTHNVLNLDVAIFRVFILGLVFNAAWWSVEPVFVAMNEPYKFTIKAVVVAIISTICVYFLSTKFGLLGAALGYLSFDIILAVLIFPKACEMMQLSVRDVFSGFKDVVKKVNSKFVNK